MSVTQGNFITAAAGADLHGKEYYIVKFDTNNAVVLATAGTDEICGVIDEAPQGATGSVSVAHVSGAGTGKVIASTTISKRAFLTATTGGKAVTTTTPGNRVFGRARDAALATNDIIEYEKMFFIYPS